MLYILVILALFEFYQKSMCVVQQQIDQQFRPDQLGSSSIGIFKNSFHLSRVDLLKACR
jgi:hypothetical protein